MPEVETFRDAFIEALQMWQDGKPYSQIKDELSQLGLDQQEAKVVTDLVMHTTYKLEGR